MKTYIKDKTIVIMGGGTAGWVSALFFLSKSKRFNYNNRVILISSDEIGSIGVGEGTTPIFKTFLENDCGINENEFLYKVGGSIKYGIKFDNWNFDKKYYYHTFKPSSQLEEKTYNFCQYAVNKNLEQYETNIQRKINGILYDLMEENKVSELFSGASYSYHFAADRLISFFTEKCNQHKNFSHISGTIGEVMYSENGYLKGLNLKNNYKIFGDIFINCLGFSGKDILDNDYYDIDYWNDKLINNSAFAIQVKNSKESVLEPYTISTAQNCGWTWKIPQYEKTGYGYVYSDKFVDNEDSLLDDIIKTYSIHENNIFKTKKLKFLPFYNKKQLNKNCLSVGLSSGFIEPLEATSIHMTILGLKNYLDIAEDVEDFNEKYVNSFNSIILSYWKSVFKFIIFHYFTKNSINDYWKHYNELKKSSEFSFIPEKYFDDFNGVFNVFSYNSISFGLKIEDYIKIFGKERYLSKFICEYFSEDLKVNIKSFKSLNEVLKEINTTPNLKKNQKFKILY